MKKSGLIVVLLFVVFQSSNGQSRGKFYTFLDKFADFSLPVNISDYMVEREEHGQSLLIDEFDYNAFLREEGDTFWKFSDEAYHYTAGGKCQVGDFWIIFYGRYFLSEEVHKLKCQIMLAAFSAEGEMISSLPATGVYGDSLMFNAEVDTSRSIKIDYHKYPDPNTIASTELYYIDNDGVIKKKD